MNMIELLTIPGLDGSAKLKKLTNESKERMERFPRTWQHPIKVKENKSKGR